MALLCNNYEIYYTKEMWRAKTMIKVYCYERCTTCKKALKWLDDNKIKYELIDIKGSNPDKTTLKAAYEKSGQPLKKFFQYKWTTL